MALPFEEKVQFLGHKLAWRTLKLTDIAPLGFSIIKDRPDKMLTSMAGSGFSRNFSGHSVLQYNLPRADIDRIHPVKATYGSGLAAVFHGDQFA